MESRMVSDSIANASIPVPAPNVKDLVKKKRVNRSAKLKQCKLDARREQWLSQVKSKDSNEEPNGRRGYSSRSMHERNDSDRSIENLEIKPRPGENDGPIRHFSDTESPSNSPSSHTSSMLSGNDSGTNFTGSSSRSSSSSSSCSRCCFDSVTDEDEEGDEGCLDDWEAVADALAATDDKKEEISPGFDSSEAQESIIRLNSPPELSNRSTLGSEISKWKTECAGKGQKAPSNCRAWRADDASRPQSLPNLSKQLSLPMNADRHYALKVSPWGCKTVQSTPSSCPICYEDLDLTDTSFDPCSCGFRLCLFCHKRILEEDARCPGCRKQYDSDPIDVEATLEGSTLALRLGRSYSMITRS